MNFELIPKPKTTVIGLGARLGTHEIVRLAWVVVTVKAYAVGKVLHLAGYLYM